MQLLFLKRGGELIYAGPLGPKSSELIKYFEVRSCMFISLIICHLTWSGFDSVLSYLYAIKIGFCRQLKECQKSGLDIILLHGCLRLLLLLKRIVSEWTLQKFTENQIYFCMCSIHKFCLLILLLRELSLFLYSLAVFFHFRLNRELVESLSKPSSNSKELNFPTKYSKSFFYQLLACLWKQNLSYWRNPQYTAVRFFYTVIISLMLGTICWRFGAKRFSFKFFLIFKFF